MVLNAPMILDYNVARRDYDAYGRYCPDKNKPVIVANSLMRPIRKYCVKLYLENIARNVRQYGDIIYNEHAKAMLLQTR